jgi:uncharacterized protein
MNAIRLKLGLPLALCGALGIATPVAAQDIKLPDTLAWTAYDVGSGGYNQAVAIGNALKSKANVSLRVLPGKNDVSRNLPLREDKVHFSANGVGGSYLAQEGLDDFGAKEWGPQRLRMLLLNNSDQLLTITTAKDAGIKTMADLKGKRVAWVVGAPSLNQNITALLAFANLTWNDVQKVEFGGFGAAMTGMINNQVDAAFASSISGPLYQLASSPRGIQYPTMDHKDKAGWDRVKKIAPFFVPFMGTEGAAMSKENPVEAATYPYPILIAYEKQNPDLVYNMTKAMFTYYDDYKAAAPGNNGWELKRQVFDWVVPFHEGAIRYYKEINVWKPEYQAHNDKLIKRQDTLAQAWTNAGRGAPSDEAAFAKHWQTARLGALKAAGFEAGGGE